MFRRIIEEVIVEAAFSAVDQDRLSAIVGRLAGGIAGLLQEQKVGSGDNTKEVTSQTKKTGSIDLDGYDLGAGERTFPAGLRIEKDDRCIGADIVADIPGKEGAVGKQDMPRMKMFVGELQSDKRYDKE